MFSDFSTKNARKPYSLSLNPALVERLDKLVARTNRTLPETSVPLSRSSLVEKLVLLSLLKMDFAEVLEGTDEARPGE